MRSTPFVLVFFGSDIVGVDQGFCYDYRMLIYSGMRVADGTNMVRNDSLTFLSVESVLSLQIPHPQKRSITNSNVILKAEMPMYNICFLVIMQ